MAYPHALAKNQLYIGYIDMMLLHHPGANDVKAYKAMEQYVEAGTIHGHVVGLAGTVRDRANVGFTWVGKCDTPSKLRTVRNDEGVLVIMISLLPPDCQTAF